MRKMSQQTRQFPRYYAELVMIAADQDCNPLALRNFLRMGLSVEIKDFFLYSDIPEEIPTIVTVSQNQHNQIRQRRTENAAQNRGGGAGFAPSPRDLVPPKCRENAPAGTVTGYIGPAPTDLSTDRRRI
jgi:hypothetical protein